MAEINISNGVIEISFPSKPDVDTLRRIKSNGFKWDSIYKCWKAPYSAQLEKIAQDVTSNPCIRLEPHNIEQTKDDNNLYDNVSGLLENESTYDDAKKIIMSHLFSNPDSLIGLLNRYKEDVKTIVSEKTKYEDATSSLKQLTARKKIAEFKKHTLETIIADIMASGNRKRIYCTDYNFALSTINTFSLTDDFVSDLKESLNLPDWLNVEFSLNTSVINGMDAIPDGVKVTKQNKIKLLKNNKSLEYFNQGLTIRQISEKTGLQWKTIFGHLKDAISRGELSIDEETLEKIKEFRENNNPNNLSLKDYAHHFKDSIKYDIIALAVSHLFNSHDSDENDTDIVDYVS